MKSSRLQTEPLREVNRYRDPDFPVGMYTVTPRGIVPEGRGYRDLHWHEEMQYTLVTKGWLSMQVNGIDHHLKEGQAIFINRNALHISTKMADDGCYLSFSFPQKLVSFFPGSRMEQKNVLILTGNVAISVLLLTDKPWHQKIIRELYTLPALLTGKTTTNFEYLISLKLVRCWYLIIEHIDEFYKTPTKSFSQKQERVRDMLTYIHSNYAHPIQLEEIAEMADISVTECCRCFKELIKKSPIQYLMDYRLDRALELLNETGLSVSEVAQKTGFPDSSHFIQRFKKRTGQTPGKYRKYEQK
ncbi:AraC family transcriptional regulator [Pseudoramibacter faecis]|uniref:AraC family transcriptional regulator n=1 Tax=Pseudoramibacter faecis TaxID=3108534 RepID=UPI002E786D6B|nr:AraC family transcriptional regulator [Pseudoramibacter sp. HA2172]